MKILIVSHNVLSKNTNMGKTLLSYFKDFKDEDIAQLYIHSEVPTVDICKNYYRVTDKDTAKSVFGCKAGRILGQNDIQYNRESTKTYDNTEKKLRKYILRKTPVTYALRNAVWKCGHWYNKKLKQWIDDFSPDCVFFASGDCSFIYDIALKIAKSRNIPLYVSCMDDFYFNNINKDKIFGKFQHKRFMSHVKKTMSYATALFCICDSMSCEYSELFNKKCVTLHTASSFSGQLTADKDKKEGISYIGNLSQNRYLQLVDIGRELKKLGHELDVYSPEVSSEIKEYLVSENGINYKGFIGTDEVKRVMARSIAVIHTESFDEGARARVKYSVSTKIADSLMSGTCIFAYGPEDVASIKYLKDNGAAVCVTSKEGLADGLKSLIYDENVRNTAVDNATVLANKNHCPGTSCRTIRDTINLNATELN